MTIVQKTGSTLNIDIHWQVGNPAFANWVVARVADITHINNKDDPVPIIPGKLVL